MRYILLCFILCASVLNAQNIEIIPLENNSASDDFAPFPTQHGRVLIFSSDRSGKQKLYSMERTSSGWGSESELDGTVNDGEQVGAAALLPDGQTMIFSAFEHDVAGQGRTDLYKATRKGGKWSSITNLSGVVNSGAYDAQPAITSDGNIMVFVSDRSSGMGGTDLFISEWTANGWTVARPLEGANTSSNEMSPYINADGRTITFASDRPGGMGGYDVYVGKLENGKVTNVKSAGAPINTSFDEMFYYSIPNSNQAFFSRTTGNGDFDNYTAVPNPFPGDAVTLVEGTVRDAVTKNPVGAELLVTDLTTQKTIAKLRSDDETGMYYVTLTAGRVYSVTAKAAGYLFHSERYEVPPNAKGQTIRKDIDLVPLTGGGERLLVFFDYDKTELKSESYPELEQLIELMRENSNLRIRFEGHTDDQGDAPYNQTLSEKRAKAVLDYVVSGGIESARVESVGYGESKPLVQGTTEDARAMNRRVEMKVLK